MSSIIAKSKAKLRWPAMQSLLGGGFYEVYKDARDGVVSYTTPINPSPIEAWKDLEGKIGFGLGPFGKGGFGGGTGGVGFGVGMFGAGPFGVGAPTIEFVTDDLPDGTWTFAVVARDAAGNAAGSAAEDSLSQVALAGTPRPVSDLTAVADGANNVKLTWSLSPDDL